MVPFCCLTARFWLGDGLITCSTGAGRWYQIEIQET
uniref:Uncharacterized protein n=1 Tax=Setaria viridis TaxID=4556 RepID=A0A4U6V4Q4_SETVI|nr:hypothetical protein SEVIR_3G032750v2 [Setaria viridis]